MKSNLIKSANVTMQSQPILIPINFPLIDKHLSAQQSVSKLAEAIDNFTAETYKDPINMNYAWPLMFELFQSMVCIQLSKNKAFQPHDDAIENLQYQVSNESEHHCKRMMNEVNEHGWSVVTG